jgi:diguanylate cyclase
MKQILVVEDDKLLSKSITAALKKAGYNVYNAVNGDQAKEALINITLDLVLLDIMLPGGLDGYSILSWMKSNPKTVSLPVIMLTNLGQTSEMDKALEMGATDYIIKANTDLSQIVTIVNKLFLN